jgi:hypothetical protein
MGARRSFAAVARGARRRGPPQHRGRTTLPAKRLASASHFARIKNQARRRHRAESGTGPEARRPVRRGRGACAPWPQRTYGLRFLLTRFSAIDVFSPSSGITIQAAR